MLRNAIEEKNMIFTGDLNFHYEAETEFLYENGYVDVWRELHGQSDPGFTWDA